MDITIGVQNLPRELVIESDQTADEVTAAVTEALTGKPVLELVDTRGRRVVVPSASIGYVEIGTESKGRVGFGAL
ncbi:MULTISPECIES: DUF3107 domain-containing protein [unclassified Cellulomonas]|uniref:DUF3107 domain-containing protein n=1 Tax=unclassified Cellulomonas TaxID=2620175 RepID=UPI0019C65F9B|nr:MULTISPECIES: DUF3107 domain-containing protein [unclassified Cellulomonas]MBD3778605.1 DUF3107 domain-containing protein [Micrococcales bacterium]QZN84947.1 DUF3107 domain-containing protein [Cellulomonas sp. C5510]WHP17098.1 DUF3107 domain-containing protein [Cellulomonas sp. ES6]